MNKLIPLITTANGNLLDKKEMLLDVVKEARELAFPKFKIDWDIDILLTNYRSDTIIPEDNIGGRAYDSSYIEVDFKNKATKYQIFDCICHKLCHAARWGKNEQWAGTLFEGKICEGLATYFEDEARKIHQPPSFFIDTMVNRPDTENQRLLTLLHNQLDSEKYDRLTLFFRGNKEYPRWTAYSVGYYIVKKYIEQTGKKIEDVFTLNYEEFRSVL